MKVVCESCHTRYAIADEKVRGKSFKIKCKKCGAFMYVRPPEGDAEAKAEKSAEPAEAVPAGLPVEPPPGPGGEVGGSQRPVAQASHSPSTEATAGGQGDEEEEKETRVFNYAEFERLMADKAEEGTPAAVVGSTARAPVGEPEWYLLYGEEQQGPLTASDVEQRIRLGEVDGETYVWREGLPDWRPLREVESLAALLTPATQIPGESPASAVSPARAGREVAVPGLLDAAYGGSSAGFVASAAPEPGSAPAGVSLDLPPPIEPPPAEKKLTAQRHEDSVLFSLKSLGVITFQEGAEAPKVVETAKVGREPRLAVAPPQEMRLGMPVGVAEGGAPGLADLPLPPPIVVPPARRGLSSGAKIGIAVGGVTVLAAAAVGIVWLLREPAVPDVPRGVTAVPAGPNGGLPVAPAVVAAATIPTAGPAISGPAPGSPTVAKGVAPTGAASPDAGSAAVAAASRPSMEAEEEESPKSGRARKGPKKRKPPQVAMAQPTPTETQPGVSVTREPIREQLEAPPPPPSPSQPPPAPSRAVDSEVKAILDEKVAKPPPRAEAPSAASSDDSSLPETLEKSTVHRVIRRNMSGIIRCYNTKVADKATKKGTLNVSFSIQRNGKTSGIRVEKPQFWGGDFVGCVGNSVSKWKFPRFKGEEIEITYPFILGGF
jgi:predicted Zn finger-like uncharacterized protein